jgi:hypothetical protein
MPMKSFSHSTKERRGKWSPYIPVRSSWAEAAVLAALGLVSLSAVVIALVSASAPVKLAEDPLQHYVRSGQLGADMRTARALGHYFFEAEPSMVTNVGEVGRTQKSLALPTNDVSG